MNEKTRNTNHVSSDEHLNVPVHLRGKVFVQRIEVAY